MIARAAPWPRHSGTTAIEASSREPSRWGLTCPQAIIISSCETATKKRRQSRPVGLIPTLWIKACIAGSSLGLAGRRVKGIGNLEPVY